jgi:DNA-binding MarR family transcriptional regulator
MPNDRGAPRSRISLSQAEEPSLQTWLGLIRVYQKVQRELDHILAEAGLTLAQFDILANLGMSEGITQQELAERLLVTKGNVCGLLDRMEAAELVERRSDPKDRRTNRVHLTRPGKTALQRAFPAHLGLIQKCLGNLSSAEQRTLARLLTRIEKSDCFDREI